MKKMYALMLAMIMILASFTACGDKKPPEDASTKEEVTTENVGNETDQTEEASTEETLAEDIRITLFTPNENADGFNQAEVVITELNENEILSQLIQAGVLNEGTAINTFEEKVEDGKTYLVLDFNEKLGDKLNSSGSSGEYVTMGSLVNTFLKAYEADYFKFTINEQIFESGHIVYDEPIGFVES